MLCGNGVANRTDLVQPRQSLIGQLKIKTAQIVVELSPCSSPDERNDYALSRTNPTKRDLCR